MKPFNLKAALAGEPVVTRNGLDVTQVTYFPDAEDKYKIAALTDGYIHTFTEEGALYGSDEEGSFDLFMKSKKRTVWVNLYPDGTYFKYETQNEADHRADVQRICRQAFPIEIEE